MLKKDMNMSKVSVIHCSSNVAGTIVFEQLQKLDFENLVEATIAAVRLAKHGFAIIIRPNYNETDDAGNRFFREWRSFNGAPFKEIRF